MNQRIWWLVQEWVSGGGWGGSGGGCAVFLGGGEYVTGRVGNEGKRHLIIP
jgi:hypothetical protein